ncbi:MAG: hypothetical protein J5750_06710 [Clostridiales bacterium]|nr:hypothetical protein [Clostridiales bacterium]
MVEQDETTISDEAKPVVMNDYLQKPTVGASAAPVSAAPEKVPDSELPEMVKTQRELEKKMKYLEKEMKRLPNLDDGTQNP